jgi:hypothetical protein
MEPLFDAATEKLMTRAKKNLDAALACEGQFPDNVFWGRWGAFFFFDADLLFQRQLAERLKALLACENGAVVCVRNLDIALYEGNPDDTVFLVRETLAETLSAYMRVAKAERDTDGTIIKRKARKADGTVFFLTGPSWPHDGWTTSFYRLGYTSEIGSWCIYCERTAEFGVIAIRQGHDPDQFSSALREFKALPIKQAIENPICYTLLPGVLSEDWRIKLLRNYSFGQERPQRS